MQCTGLYIADHVNSRCRVHSSGGLLSVPYMEGLPICQETDEKMGQVVYNSY